MLRKTFIFSCLFVCSASAWSNGFYIGVGAGPEAADFEKNATVVQPNYLYIKDQTHLSGTGYFGSLFGGYKWIFNTFYIATELNANVSNVEHDVYNKEFVNSNFGFSSYRMRQSYGISVLPGYLFTPATLFYARLGYALGNLYVSTPDTTLKKVNTYLNGIALGVGISQALSEKIALRMEYTQVNYQNKSFTTYNTNAVTKTTKIQPTTGQVEFALIYNFT